MDPSMNFRKYRNLLSNARPPFIPIYPMVSKDLTFIHLGNESTVEGLVNFEKLRLLAKEIRALTNMCSSALDIFASMERQGAVADFSAMRRLNPSVSSTSTTMRRAGKGGAQGQAGKEALNAKKMYEEAQMVRRVKAYLAKMPVISDEEELHRMSAEVEPPPAASTTTTTAAQRTLSGQGSMGSLSVKSATSSKRGQSPTPSTQSNASSSSASTAHPSSSGVDGAKPKFGKNQGAFRSIHLSMRANAIANVESLEKDPEPETRHSQRRRSSDARSTLPAKLDAAALFREQRALELKREKSVRVERSRAAAALLLEGFGHAAKKKVAAREAMGEWTKCLVVAKPELEAIEDDGEDVDAEEVSTDDENNVPMYQAQLVSIGAKGGTLKAKKKSSMAEDTLATPVSSPLKWEGDSNDVFEKALLKMESKKDIRTRSGTAVEKDERPGRMFLRSRSLSSTATSAGKRLLARKIKAKKHC